MFLVSGKKESKKLGEDAAMLDDRRPLRAASIMGMPFRTIRNRVESQAAIHWDMLRTLANSTKESTTTSNSPPSALLLASL